MEKEIIIEVRASRRYREDFVREIEEGVRDIVEGRVMDLEDLLEKHGVRPKAEKP